MATKKKTTKTTTTAANDNKTTHTEHVEFQATAPGKAKFTWKQVQDFALAHRGILGYGAGLGTAGLLLIFIGAMINQ